MCAQIVCLQGQTQLHAPPRASHMVQTPACQSRQARLQKEEGATPQACTTQQSTASAHRSIPLKARELKPSGGHKKTPAPEASYRAKVPEHGDRGAWRGEGN